MLRNTNITPRIKPYLSDAEFTQTLINRKLWTPLVKSAYEISTSVHEKAVRNDGVPYLNQHIFPVTVYTIDFFQNDLDRLEVATIVSLLHDSIENSPAINAKFLKEKFGNEVSIAVASLTKPKLPGNRTQEVKHQEHGLLLKQLNNAPEWVRIIKIIDRINNLICTDAYRRPKQYRRFIKDTEVYYLPLASKMDQNLEREVQLEVNRVKKELSLLD